MTTKKAEKLPLSVKIKKPRGKGKPFEKGFDVRRNLDGPPKKFNELRELYQRLLSEEIKLGQGTKEEKIMSQIELVGRQWILSGDFPKQNRAVEIAYGKVPDELNVHSDIETFIHANLELFTDGQLQRITAGEDPFVIVAELLRDAAEAKKKKK